MAGAGPWRIQHIAGAPAYAKPAARRALAQLATCTRANRPDYCAVANPPAARYTTSKPCIRLQWLATGYTNTAAFRSSAGYSVHPQPTATRSAADLPPPARAPISASATTTARHPAELQHPRTGLLPFLSRAIDAPHPEPAAKHSELPTAGGSRIPQVLGAQACRPPVVCFVGRIWRTGPASRTFSGILFSIRSPIAGRPSLSRWVFHSYAFLRRSQLSVTQPPRH